MKRSLKKKPLPIALLPQKGKRKAATCGLLLPPSHACGHGNSSPPPPQQHSVPQSPPPPPAPPAISPAPAVSGEEQPATPSMLTYHCCGANRPRGPRGRPPPVSGRGVSSAMTCRMALYSVRLAGGSPGGNIYCGRPAAACGWAGPSLLPTQPCCSVHSWPAIRLPRRLATRSLLQLTRSPSPLPISLSLCSHSDAACHCFLQSFLFIPPHTPYSLKTNTILILY